MEDQEQFTRLWTDAQPKLAGYINALVPDFHEAEDLLQEVAVLLMRKFSQYDPQRPFMAWAIGFTKREVLMARRRQARNFLCFQPELLDQISEAYAEQAPELDDRSRLLNECLRAIKGRAHDLIRLRYEDALGPDSIAGRLGMAAVAVRVALSRTRSILRHCIERKLKNSWQP